MYRRPLAGVFEFGFCANGENEKQSQKRRPEASGTNSESEKNDVVLCAKHPRSSAPSSLGHRRHFQDRLPAGPVLLKGDTKMKKDTANGRALFLFTFVLVASRAVEMPGLHAALLETGDENRTGRDRFCRVFRRAPCRYERRGSRASLSFLMENLYGACCWVRRKNSLLIGVSPSRWIARHIAKGKRPSSTILPRHRSRTMNC